MSGIDRKDLFPRGLTEPDLVLIGDNDRLESIKQLRTLKASDYEVFVSMELFNPSVQVAPDLEVMLRESFAKVAAGLE
jgi:predicted xylose isomerase-like sugar epimerase